MSASTPALPDPQVVYTRIRTHFARGQQPSPHAHTDSCMARADAAIHPYLLSATAWTAWSTASDQLEGARVLVQDAGRIQPIAQYTLLRSALENAATVIWVLRPPSQAERTTRALRLAATNIRESAKVMTLTGLKSPSGRSAKERLGDIEGLALANGLNPQSAVKKALHSDIVAGSATSEHDGTMLKAAWSLGSGFAHGQLWAHLSYLDRQEMSRDAKDVLQLRTTGNLESLLLHLATVAQLLDEAFTLYEKRCAPQA